jgi:hypothetical protein
MNAAFNPKATQSMMSHADGGAPAAPSEEAPTGGGGAAADEAALLVNNASIPSAVSRERRRTAADKAQRLISDVCGDMPDAARIIGCGKIRHQAAGVVVKQAPEGYAFASGVTTCGSLWGCISCSYKIRAKRAADIAAAIRAQIGRGGGVLFATLTISHRNGELLEDLWDLIGDGWSYMTSGAAWQDFKATYGLVGFVRSVEVTHGVNGWHPHIHVVFFLDQPLTQFSDEEKFFGFRRFIRDRWIHRFARKHGRDVSQEIGVRVDPVKSDDATTVGMYTTKVGYELAMADTKIGRTEGQRHPFAIAKDAADTGDMADVRLLREWIRQSKGRKCITWSTGLREDLLGGHERTDEELAAEETEGEAKALVHADVWRQIIARRDAARSRFLLAFENGGDHTSAAAFLAGIGIRVELDQQGSLPLLRPPNNNQQVKGNT